MELEKAKKQSPHGDRFIMTGFRTDISRILAAFDIFCMSSKEEGLGTSILDAMAMELPVVACKAGGIPEAVEHQKTGLLVPVQDSQTLASAIMDLIDDPKKARAMGQAGRLRVERLFNITMTVEKTEEIYFRLMGE